MQGAGWAPELSPVGGGVVRVGVPESTLGLGSEQLGGKGQQAPRAGVFGAPFRALVLRGLRGLQGTRRGSPRAPPLARARSVSVVGNVGAEAESERGDRPGVGVGCWPRVLRGRRVSWCPARRAPALWGIARPAPEARLSLALAVLLGQLRCVSCGGPEQWAGAGDGNEVEEPSKLQPFHQPPPGSAPVAGQCVV